MHPWRYSELIFAFATFCCLHWRALSSYCGCRCLDTSWCLESKQHTWSACQGSRYKCPKWQKCLSSHFPTCSGMPGAPDYPGFGTLVCSVPVHLTLLAQMGYLSMPEKSAATMEGVSGVSILQLLEGTTSSGKLKHHFDCLEANHLFCKTLQAATHFL